MDTSIHADIVGMTVITGSAFRAYELSDKFRARGIPLVLGGPHVTLVPEDAKPHADSVVVGYAEETWPQLLRDFVSGALKNRYDQSPDLKLKNLPFARRDMLPEKRYTTTNVFEATRGCIHACEFCVVPSAWGRKPYQKPVGDVVADLKQHGAKKALFIDLNLIADRQYATELFAALVPLKIKWFGLATTLLADDVALLESMARSGCKGLLIVLESINAESLKSTKKGFNRPDNYLELTRLLHNYGISLMGCFVFGYDHDTPDTFLETAKLAIEAKIDLPRFATLTPFPGPPLFSRFESEERILTRSWELYDGQHVVFQPKKLSVKQLQDGTGRAWRQGYKYSSILKRIARSPAPLLVRIAANLGYRFYGRNLDKFYTCDWFIGPDSSSRQKSPKDFTDQDKAKSKL